MGQTLRTLVPVGAVVGALVGLAFAPWLMWSAVGAISGALYAGALGFAGARLVPWLGRGSAVRHAGVMVGGGVGAVGGALACAVGAVAKLVPSSVAESAELFAVGALGVFTGGPLGFLIGGVIGGGLTCFFEWLDTRHVAPLRAKSLVVDRATIIGTGLGVVIAGALVFVYGGRRRAGRPEPPVWLPPVAVACFLLGILWTIRDAAKRNRAAAVGGAASLAHTRNDTLAVVTAIGIAGGAVGFAVGALLYALGWRAPRR
jgi:hypothetical protein